MKAVRVQDEQVTVQDVDEPVPDTDQAVVRITATGVCHSDLHLARGDWYGMRPQSIGHEAIGVVEELGPGAERFISIGEGVILGLGGTGGGYCGGPCKYCMSAHPRHCAQAKGVMGTFSERFAVYARGLVSIP